MQKHIYLKIYRIHSNYVSTYSRLYQCFELCLIFVEKAPYPEMPHTYTVGKFLDLALCFLKANTKTQIWFTKWCIKQKTTTAFRQINTATTQVKLQP